MAHTDIGKIESEIKALERAYRIAVTDNKSMAQLYALLGKIKKLKAKLGSIKYDNFLAK